MKRQLQHLLILLILTPYVLHSQENSSSLQTFINTPELKHASIGICVKDITGKELISYNPDKAYTPASILKVVTTATALEELGPDFRYTTTLSIDKNKENRLVIEGHGDPTLGTKHLNNSPYAFIDQWTEKIKQFFDSDKSLDIIMVDDYFGYDGISDRWIYQDIGNYYAAGSYGISVFDNTYELFFNTTRRDTCPVIIKTEPAIDLNFQNAMNLNYTGKDNGYIHGTPFSETRLLTGDIPAGRTSFSIKGDIPNPPLFLGKIIADRLTDGGYKIGNIDNTHKQYNDNRFLKNRNTVTGDVFYSHRSFPLKDIIRETNVKSNNHYAEHLIRTIGRTKNPDIYDSALEKGIQEIETFWKDKGLETSSLMLFDGSGLAPSNAVSAAFLCDLLVYMQAKSKYSTEFLESLPKAGQEGTVRNRLKGTRLAGKISMKSGSINGVQCFAGYYIDGDKKYAFTIMVNKFTGNRNQIVKAIDQFLLSIF